MKSFMKHIPYIIFVLMLFVTMSSRLHIVNAKDKSGEISLDPIEMDDKREAESIAAPISLTLDGKEYTLPFAVQELINDGWMNVQKETEYIPLYSYTNRVFTKEDKSITVHLMNPTPIAITDFHEVLVYSIQADIDLMTFQDDSNITSEWNKQDVRDFYGKPHLADGKYRGSDKCLENGSCFVYSDLEFIQQECSYVAAFDKKIFFNKEGKVDQISATSIFVDIEKNLNDIYTPDSYYKRPDNLGIDVRSFRIQLENQLYELPLPLNYLIDSGWKLPDDVKTYIDSNHSITVDLTKENQKVTVEIANDAIYAKKTIYCDIICISTNALSKVHLELPEDIKLGASVNVLKNDSRYHSYSMDEVNPSKQKQYHAEKNYQCYEYYEFIPQSNGNELHTYENEYYTGFASFDLVDDKIVGITYGHDPKKAIGKINVTAQEKNVEVKNKKDAKLYFNYAVDQSVWKSKEGNTFTFYQDGTISISMLKDNWVTTNQPQPFTIDAKKQQLIIDNGTYILDYDIISSERVVINYSNKNKKNSMELITRYVHSWK